MDKIKVFDGCFNPIKHIKNDDIFIVLTPEEKNVLMVTREKFNEVVPDTANENNKLTDKEYVDGIKTELDTDIATINSKIPSTASNTNKLTDKLYVDELVAAEQSRAENVEDLLDRSIDHEVERATTKETLLENAITIINSKIPSTATDTNKLVDKAFVDSIIDDVNDSIDIIDEVTAASLYNLNERKQDIIEDLETIRSGAALGETAYQKPLNGIPASDIANGVIPDVSQFITKSVNDLVNYYTKSLTYTQSEVNALIGSIQQFHYEIYPSLQDITTPATNVLYLIGPTGSGSDKYEEYVYANNSFTKIGDTTIDLSGYVTTQALNTALANYVTSTDLTTLLSGKQDNLVSGTNIKTINSQSILGSGNLDVKDIFIVEYGVTTYQQVLDAYNAGKHLILKYDIYGNSDDWRFLPLQNVVISRDGASVGTYAFTFSAIDNNYSFLCTIDIYGYSQTTTNLQQKLTFDNTPTSGSTNPVTSVGIKIALDNKQDTLVSGTNIKTINNLSILGSGNIDVKDIFIVEYNVTTYSQILNAYNAGKHLILKYIIDGNPDDWRFLPLGNVTIYSDGGLVGTYGFYFTVINGDSSISCVVDMSGYSLGSTKLQQKLTFDNTPTAYSNNPVKSSGIKTALDNKQDKLVSGTNIKTINNQSVLGSGNLDVKEVFIAEYGVTTYQEIKAAVDGGKFVLCHNIKDNLNFYYQFGGYTLAGLAIVFYRLVDFELYSIGVTIGNIWSSDDVKKTLEIVDNKVTNLNSPDNTKYPTTQAVANYAQPKIDSTHKLDAGLVDDTNSTHKFVTSAQTETWDTVTEKAPLPFVVTCGIDPSNVSFVNSTLDEIWEAYRNNKTIRVNFAKAGGVTFEDDATLLLDGSRNCVVHTVHNGTHYTITIYEDNGVTNLSYAETHDSDKQDVISDLSTIRSGAAKGATAYQKPSSGIPESDLTSELQQTIDNVPSILQSISAISDLVPEQASSSNQLADKNFVNSSIQTNTAEFKGTRNLVTDLSLTTSATQQQIAAALASAISSADNNDYCFVQIPTDDATPTQIARVDRYKYNGGAWLFEWSLNNSSFTAEQWAAINSTVTSGDVDKLRLLPTKAQLDTLFAAKQNTLISGTNIKTINGNSILGSGNLDVKDIFIVEYEVTTYQDVVNAYNAGKYLILKYSLPSMSEDYRLLLLEDVTISIDGVTQGTYSFTFSAISGTRSYSVHLTTNGYEPDITYVLQTELTFDNAPTANSYNPVISWGIKNALDNKQTALTDAEFAEIFDNIDPSVTPPDVSNFVTITLLNTNLALKENTSNKVISLSDSSTDTQYPSAKCVYDFIAAQLGNINSILETI